MNTTDRHGILTRIAADVADRRPVDWGKLTESHPDLAPLLLHLAAVEGIASKQAPCPPALAEGARWGPLELIEKIGEGTFGEVFRARDPVLQRDVALKLGRRGVGASGLPGDPQLEEARRLARVRHANVVTIHGIEVHDDRVGLWTDLLRGRTLEAVLDDEGPLSVEEIAHIGVGLCGALQAIHDAGVLHGDVKAANIMREPNGHVVLMDFGAGRRFVPARMDEGQWARSGEALAAPGSTTTRIAGTPLVSAPEVLEGASPSVASDIYALGVLLYRLATGRYPVNGTSLADLRKRLASAERVPVDELRPDLPPAIGRAVHRALAFEPADRFETAAQFASSLRLTLDALGVTEAGPVHPRPRGATTPDLPHLATRFLGRKTELAHVHELLDTERWVTLVGPGGSGKTRLALEVASSAGERYPDGIRWIDLSGLRDAAYFLSEVGRMLGLRTSPGGDERQAMARAFRDRSLLLAVDNAEHLARECRDWIELVLGAAPRARFLVTSRESLQGANEVVFDVRPLAVPPESLASTEDPGSYDAVRLFVDRACAGRRDFRLTPANAPVVARICRRVDGIPLAIELAAARVATLAVDEIDRRLASGARVLSNRSAETSRHETVEAMLEWSWDLLDDPMRSLLARLAVFRGGFTITSAEHVCADVEEDVSLEAVLDARRDGGSYATASPASTAVATVEIMDLLGDLARRSLLVFDADRERYRLYEVVREFAGAKLRASRGEEAMVRRHARHFAIFAVESDRASVGPDQIAWLARQRNEHDNVHAAIAAATLDRDHPELGLRLVRALGPYWARYGLFRLGRAHLATQLARAECQEPDEHRAAALTWAGIFAYEMSDHAEARRSHEESKRIQEARGDAAGVATSLAGLGDVANKLGEYELARECYEKNLAIMRTSESRPRFGVALNKLAIFNMYRGNLERSRELHEEHLALQREIDNLDGVAFACTGLATTLGQLREMDLAIASANEALAIRRRTGDKVHMATTLALLADLHHASHRRDAALPFLREAILIQRESGRPSGILHGIEVLSTIAEYADWHAESLTLMSAVSALRESLGEAPTEHARQVRDARVRKLTAALGEDGAHEASVAGRAMTLDDAASYALRVLDARRPVRGAGS